MGNFSAEGLALRQSSDQAIQYLDQAIGLAKKTPNAGYPFVAVAGKIQALINKREFGPALSLINEAKHEAETRRKNIKLAQLFYNMSNITYFFTNIYIRTSRIVEYFL